MEPQEYINEQVTSGKDIVFGEHHGSVADTLGMMEETIRQNPGQIHAVSVEYSSRIQPLIDQVASGALGQEDFIRLCRVSNEQEYMEIASALHNEGRLSDAQYTGYLEFTEKSIEAAMNGTTNEAYTPERQAKDIESFGALHKLITTSAENSVPVFASDLGRETLVLASMRVHTVAELIDRMDDTTDGQKLGQQIDLSTEQSILAHRGAYHVWDVTYEPDPLINSRGKGMDDFLEAQGRDVVTIGNYESLEVLIQEVERLNAMDIDVSDPTDATIINGQLIEQPDQDLAAQGAIAVPGLSGNQ